MKTYLLDILNKYNRFSENLDVKTILCNKSWLVFNDTGNKELYIFQENGNLIASVNGNVHNGNWQYISANKSIILSFKEQSYMLHPSFFDKTIFALQQDGTNKYAFMIDEKQSQSFQPKSLTELNSYFENIERKRIEEEQHSKRLQAEQQRANEQRRIEEERREQIKRQQEQVQQYKNNKRLEYWEQNQDYILQNDLSYKKLRSTENKWIIIKTISIIGTIISFFFLISNNPEDKIYDFAGILFTFFLMLSIFVLVFSPQDNSSEYKEAIKQNILNGDLDDYIFKSNYQKTNLAEDTFESIDDFETRISKKNKRVEKREQERESKRKQEIEDNKRKIEERKKKEKEWEEYKNQREKNDYDRIEQHRIEREKREKEERILREQENIKKEKEKKEQELREQELREREERKKWLKEEAFNIQCKLNSNKNANELAKQISLDIKYLNAQYDKDLIFKVNWICPNHTYKEVSLIINNGNDTSLYEHLAILGSQIIELKEVKSVIRVTLRLVWLDIPVYRIILIDKNENT